LTGKLEIGIPNLAITTIKWSKNGNWYTNLKCQIQLTQNEIIGYKNLKLAQKMDIKFEIGPKNGYKI